MLTVQPWSQGLPTCCRGGDSHGSCSAYRQHPEAVQSTEPGTGAVGICQTGLEASHKPVVCCLPPCTPYSGHNQPTELVQHPVGIGHHGVHSTTRAARGMTPLPPDCIIPDSSGCSQVFRKLYSRRLVNVQSLGLLVDINRDADQTPDNDSKTHCAYLGPKRTNHLLCT